MVLSDRVWSTSASSNWGTDEVHGLIWAAEVCWAADRRRPDSRRPWQSVVPSFADDGITCGLRLACLSPSMEAVGDRLTCLRGGGRGLGQDFLDFHDS